jgi:hypothetical protein
LWILHTLWERHTCTNTGHVSVFHRLCLLIDNTVHSVTAESQTSAQCVGSQCHQVHRSPVPHYKCLPNTHIMKTVQLSTWLFLVQCTRVGTVSSVRCLLERHSARGLHLTARPASSLRITGLLATHENISDLDSGGTVASQTFFTSPIPVTNVFQTKTDEA